MKPIRELVGENVKSAREHLDAPERADTPRRRSVSQAEVGVAVGPTLGTEWDRRQVSRAETGNRAFTVDELVALAVALKVTVVDLLTPRGAGDYRTQDGGTIAAAELERAVGLAMTPSSSDLRTALDELRVVEGERAEIEERHRNAVLRVVRAAERIANEANR